MKNRIQNQDKLSSLLAIVMIFFAVLLIISCNGGRMKYPDAPTTKQKNAFNLERGKFKTDSIAYDADFGTILVPQNRTGNDSKLIELPFVRIISKSSQKKDPVFALTGGPGMSNLNWKPKDSILNDRDFVMVGYRGVDGPILLDCPEVSKATSTNKDVLGKETLQEIGKAWNACIDRFQKEGIDLNGYTMPEVVEDFEAVCNALEYDKINLLSESYGTRVAYIYGIKHPERINKSVMIGVNPPGRFVWESDETDYLIRYYSKLWQDDPEMKIKSPDLEKTIRNVLQNMPEKWLFFSISQSKVKLVSFAMLFHRKTAAMVFDAFISAEKGDPSGLALMSFAFNFVVPSMFTWGDLATKAVSADYNPERNYFEIDRPDSILGSPLSKLLWAPLQFSKLNLKQIPEEFRNPMSSNVETLLLSGSVDFSTPERFALNEMLPKLPKGKQIVLKDLGHVYDVWSIKPEAVEKIINSYYETGVPDTSLWSDEKMNFETSFGFPRIAKIALATTTVIAIGILAGVGKILMLLI